MFSRKFKVVVLVMIALCHVTMKAKMSDAELLNQLKQKDSEFFEKGFNQCDFDYLNKNISESLTFYHDQSGIQDKSLFMSNTRQYICGNAEQKPIRKLVPGTLATYPLYNDGKLYGAIQTGKHNFYIRQPGGNDRFTSTAQFSSLWSLQNQQWVLSHVLSFDHHSPIQAELIKKALVQNHVPALGIGVISGGSIDTTEVFGELEKGKHAPQNTLFKVASLTKPVIALVALKLVDAGLLDLDEPLYNDWIDPDVKDDDRHKGLTTRHVLTHQTGFKNWRWMEPDKKLRFHFKPGEKHQYSGEGFEYLRRALERKTNTPIETLAKKYVFEPANMNDTHFWWDETMDESRFAVGHDDKGNALPVEKYYQANAAANLLTTVEDYSLFLVYLMEQEKQMPVVYGDMIRPQVSIKDKNFFGLGWEIFTGFSNDEVALLHTGKDPGVNTLAIFFPKSKNAYVIFMNGDNSLPMLERLLPSLYLGKELWQRR